MKDNKVIHELITNGHLKYIPHISVDCVILGYHANQLNVLLNKWKDAEVWSLPGGYVERNESVDTAAHRVLWERTGVDKLFLQQFYTFGDPDRINMNRRLNRLPVLFQEGGKELHNWMAERFISIGYYALVEYSKVSPRPDHLSVESRWWDIHDLPALIFDHDRIISHALHAVRLQLKYQPVGLSLLPEKFTLPELQKLYETILSRKLDRRNFQKKMLSLGILRRLPERKTIGPHRSPFLYSFDKRKYNQALKEGYGFA